MGGNVHVKCGHVLTVLENAISTGAGNPAYKDSPKSAIQAIVTGSGAVSATVIIEVSNNAIHWCVTPAGTITLSGSGSASDGFVTDSSWKYIRANVTALSGGSVSVLMGV